MKHHARITATICAALLTVVGLYLYLTTCVWQIKELLIVLAAVGASFGLGLSLRADL